MKKPIILLFLGVSIALNIFLVVINNRLETILDYYIQSTKTSENVISLVDTIYGRRYVVDIDTITGNAKIIGPRTFEEKKETTIK